MQQVVKQFQIKLLKKIKISKDTYSFYFERPAEFEFLPGNFLRLTLSIPHPDERGVSRFFSIASSPTEKDYIMISARIIKSSYKKTLLDITDGSQVSTSAPYGRFIFDKEDRTTHIFLAGGIGVTPFRSMIRYASDLNVNIRIIVLESFRTPEDIIFHDEFAEIAKNRAWFTFVETITRPEDSNQQWTGTVGRIDTNMIKKYVEDIASSKFYIAGPPQMVNDLKEVVLTLQPDGSKIITEIFTGY